MWTYEVHELSEGYSAVVYDEHGQMVADHLTEDQARLIALAPSMAEALDNVTAALESVLAHFAGKMPKADAMQREKLCAEARLILARLGGKS